MYLQHLLYDMKDQLRSYPRLNLAKNINSYIWSYYKFLKIQAFVITDTLFVNWTILLVGRSLTFHLYGIHNLPLLCPTLQKIFQFEIEH